jgi:hypothetical protein
LTEVPAGATVVAFWHTHPTQNGFSDLDVRRVAARFISPADERGHTINFRAGYVAGPDRIIYEYAPADKNTAVEDLRSANSAMAKRAGIVP